MIVRCENCQTEFALDDAQVGPEGVTVRCSMCAYVFKVRPPAGSAADQPWQIQTTEDLLFTAPDLEALKAWIVEGRLHPDDKVSRTGNHWLRLGEMPEFSAMFPGYGDLPKVFEPVPGRPKKADSERSAVDELGPPPVFGSEVSDVKLAAATSPLGGGQAAHPSSPLDAVTKHTVRPITSSTLDSASSAAKSTASARKEAAASESWDDARAHARRRGGTTWMLWAALGVASAVALVFGVPQIRGALLGSDEDPDAAPPEVAVDEPRPELDKARTALETLGVADISRAEAAIQRTIDTGAAKDSALASLKLAQADLLASRGLAYTIAAAIDEAQHERLIKKADDDLDHANRVFENIGPAPDGERVSLVRARLRLAQGRDGAEILALLPEKGAEELQLAVEASPLWLEANAKLPDDLIRRLQALDKPSALGRSVLALAMLRAGDREGAVTIADQLLAVAADQPVGLAIKAPGQATPDPVLEAPPEETGETGEPSEPADADEGGVAVASTGAGSKKPPSTGGGTGGGTGGSGGNSFERLLEKGCEQVDSGDAGAGVSTLLKAFDLNPRDLDVLVCLGKGYERQQNGGRALHFYERALEQSPRHRSALRGAAAIAAESGATAKALGYYKRLLQVDPMNAKAKLYVEQNGGGQPSGDDGKGQADSGAEPQPTE